jgi:hypothetical protein
MNIPILHPGDLMIMTPAHAASLNDADLPGDRFHLIRVLEDKGDNFDFEPVDSGPCALVEALALAIVPDGRQVWMPPSLGEAPRERTIGDF